MGKYVQTALHSALTNKLGTVVYYKHKKGISFRAVSVKAQVASPDRTRVRGYLKTSAAAWNATLTQPQRAAWNAAALAGDFRMNRRPRGRLSGWQWFHRANLTLLNIGKPILAAPVQISAPNPVTSFSIDTLDATSQTIKLAITGASGAHTHLIIYATGNREIDQLADQRWIRQVAVIPPGWTSPVDISADWTTKFGTLNGSVRVAFAVATADDRDGQLSARQYTAGISTGSSMPSATTVTITTTSLGTNATATGQVAAYKTFLLIAASASCRSRLRLYASAKARDKDASRPWGKKPQPYLGAELLADVQLAGSKLNWQFSPPALASNVDAPRTTATYWSITNLGNPQVVTLTLTVLQMEA